ncbi:MerR family transcriptional regulator [Oceanibaculum indicum]|uniref:MerR-like DNA binding protein n=1 Tax=Oceanibaculum indicum TaxID=526216 RepID=A0A420WQR5_9PROT|nr:MerR family transcriptional regulator [Oceanibaculum indicum]RKQ73206.1 MerR-like DNA binding protein [Oceanibaculum indicum]
MSVETVSSPSSAQRRGSGKSAAAFRTISEVASELDVPPHVLRFWETKFSQIRPMKRGGGRRYYRPEDVDLLRRIRELLYKDGYTIKGVQRLLRDGIHREDGDDESGEDEDESLEADGFSADSEESGDEDEAEEADLFSDSGTKKTVLAPVARAELEAAMRELTELSGLLRQAARK